MSCDSEVFICNWQKPVETMEFLIASGLCFDGVLPGLTSHPAPCQEFKFVVRNSFKLVKSPSILTSQLQKLDCTDVRRM